jgi:hypothetical protein
MAATSPLLTWIDFEEDRGNASKLPVGLRYVVPETIFFPLID